MIRIKRIIAFLLFFMLVSSAYAAMPETITSYDCTNRLFNDSFDYADAFGNHGWSVQDMINGTPLFSPFSTNALAINHSWSAGSGQVQQVWRTLPSKLSEGTNLIIFNTSVLQYTIHDGDVYTIQLRNSTGAAAEIKIDYANAGTNEIIVTNDFGGDGCNISYLTTHLNMLEWSIEIDFDANLYSIYINKSAVGCNNRQLNDGRDMFISVIEFNQAMEGTGAANTVKQYIDDIIVCSAVGAKACDTGFPIAFCDDFNYDSPMLDQGWNVFIGGSSIQANFSPRGQKLNLSDTVFFAPQHNIDPFPVSYNIDSGAVVTQSINAPVFSVEFDVYIENLGYRYLVKDQKGDIIYLLRAFVESNGSVSYSYADTLTAPLTYTDICSNCSIFHTFNDIKTNIYFNDKGCDYNFNSSIEHDHWDLYINGIAKGLNLSFLESTACSVNDLQFIKDVGRNFVVDDYFVMVGTDKNIVTHTNYFVQFFDNITIVTPTISGVEDDLATDIESIWVTFNLRTALSRTTAGLLLMFVFAVVYIFTMVGAKVEINGGAMAGLVIIEVALMILLTVIRLLPLWIPFVMIIFGGGIGFMIAKSMLSE